MRQKDPEKKEKMKQSRHEKIAELIEEYEIETQEELADKPRPPYPGISVRCSFIRCRQKTAGRSMR